MEQIAQHLLSSHLALAPRLNPPAPNPPPLDPNAAPEALPNVCCTVQEEDKSLGTVLERFMTFTYEHVVKTRSFCNTTKPRPDRSRVSGLRAEKIEDLIYFGSRIDRKWRSNLWISDRFGATSHLTACQCKEKVLLHRKSFPNITMVWGREASTKRSQHRPLQ